MQQLFNETFPLLKKPQYLPTRYREFLINYPIHDEKWHQFMIRNQLFSGDGSTTYELTNASIDLTFEHYLLSEHLAREYLTVERFPYVLDADWMTPEKLEGFLPYFEKCNWDSKLVYPITSTCLPFFTKYFEKCQHWDWLSNSNITPQFLEKHFDCRTRSDPEDWAALVNYPNFPIEYWDNFFERFPPLPEYHDDPIFQKLAANKTTPVTFFETWLPFLGKQTWGTLLTTTTVTLDNDFFLEKWPFIEKSGAMIYLNSIINAFSSETIQTLTYRLILAGCPNARDTLLEPNQIHHIVSLVQRHILPAETIDIHIRSFRRITMEDCRTLTPTQFVQLLL